MHVVIQYTQGGAFLFTKSLKQLGEWTVITCHQPDTTSLQHISYKPLLHVSYRHKGLEIIINCKNHIPFGSNPSKNFPSKQTFL